MWRDSYIRQRNLVRPPGPFKPVTADLLRRPPALRRAQHDHRPPGARGNAGGTGFLLELPDLGNAVLDGRRHRLVHAVGVGALHEVWSPAVATEQIFHFLVADPGEQRRVVDLIAVEMKNRQNSAITRGYRIWSMCQDGQRPRLRFPVPDHRRNNQVGIIKSSAAGVRKHIAQLAAFMDGARCLRSAVATDAAGERELLEELP